MMEYVVDVEGGGDDVGAVGLIERPDPHALANTASASAPAADHPVARLEFGFTANCNGARHRYIENRADYAKSVR
jgi:hypothetical protein